MGGRGWRAQWVVPVTGAADRSAGKDGTLGVDEAIALATELVDHVEAQRAAREAARVAALGGHDPTLADAMEAWLDNRVKGCGRRIPNSGAADGDAMPLIIYGRRCSSQRQIRITGGVWWWIVSPAQEARS
jgi:hypothetical protein